MELNRTYIIRVMVGNELLTYTAKIISKDDRFVGAIDKYGETIYLALDSIKTFQEKKQ